jgi:hypothetical protein
MSKVEMQILGPLPKGHGIEIESLTALRRKAV